MTIPALPYAWSSGHSGTDTSRARADLADTSGTTTVRQALVLRLAYSTEDRGITVKELREYTGWHHGTASGLLSNLHLKGHLARLSDTRDRCKVYVLPDQVQSREAEWHGQAKPEPHLYYADSRKPGPDVLAVIDSAGFVNQVRFDGRWATTSCAPPLHWHNLAFPVQAVPLPPRPR